jgi:hypothetical protein
MRQKLEDSAKLAVAAVSTANGYSVTRSKSIVISAVVGISLLWTIFVVIAFTFFSRVATRNGERFRLSLGFSMATLVFPFFAVVPVCLNVY